MTQEKFEKKLLWDLMENTDGEIYKAVRTSEEYIKNQAQLKIIEQAIESHLPDRHKNLLERYEHISGNLSSFETDVTYLRGLQDAVRVLRMLEVI